MSGWRDSLSVVDRRVLPPDPAVMSAIGRSHALHSALADLVDNSVDAGARKVVIRFVMRRGRLVSLLVADDGRGMDDDAIDAAMTVGRRRDYGEGSLGHFGMGLKAASFSQAESLTVLSRRRAGPAVGRRWVVHDAAGFECDVIDPAVAAAELDAPWLEGRPTGTLVRWDGVRSFPAARDPAVTSDFLEREGYELRAHLGLVLHRLLQEGRVSISTDVLDADQNEVGSARAVEPIDPFGYRHSGDREYPRTLAADVAGRTLPLECHIWPARSESTSSRLYGRSAEAFQGLYYYRNDRLLQAGGWGGAVVAHRRLQLARVAVDISAHADLFSMSMEKHAVHARPEFVRALEHAEGFADYLQAAQGVYRAAQHRTRGRSAVLPPGKGIGPDVRHAVADELPFLPGGQRLDIRWARLEDDRLFDVDRGERTLWLNTRYRNTVLGGRRGSLNDAPLVKTLLYLLLEDVFRGTYYGARDKDNVELWQTLLTAAVKAQADGA